MSDTIHVQHLQPGDVIDYHDVRVTILREPTDGSDLFGRRMLNFWARREDTGEEGNVIFGPTGFAKLAGDP